MNGINPYPLPMYYRNTEDGHIDMMLHLGQIGLPANLDSSLDWMRLSQWAKLFGMEKLSIKDGEVDIDTMYETENWSALEVYNKNDVDITAELFTRFKDTIQWSRYE